MKLIDLKINNSKNAAVPISKTRKLTGQWKDPGAKLYDQLLNSHHIVGNKVPDDSKEFQKLIKEGKYITWQNYLREAYMVAPVEDINNSPYGVTPFSRSGCKYPHHVIKNGELIISIPGLRAAYICARNQGVLVNHTPENKKIVQHFNRHFKELGLKPEWRYGEFYLVEDWEASMDGNFRNIYSFIMEKTGINLFDDNYIDESADGVLEGPNDSVLSSKIFDVIGRRPEEIYKWMHENISYDKSISNWRLKTPAEVYRLKKGNCHDQSLFEAILFHSLGIINGQLFFVEFKKDDPIGGNTHTLTWYRVDTPMEDYKYSYYWFENAWEDQAGIHGPYNDLKGLQHAVFEIYKKDNDINQHQYDGIVFGKNSNYRCGMSLGEYVESWRLDNDYWYISDDESTRDIGSEANYESLQSEMNELSSWIEDFVNNDEFRDQHIAGSLYQEDVDAPPELNSDEETKKESLPKQTDKAEISKNGIRRKKLYIAFIEWCKAYNNKNVFGSIFDKDAFKVTYTFIPDEMRYFYRLANPILCVLSGQLTFFQASELRKLNKDNHRLSEMIIFAATPNDMRIFNIKDKKVYRGTEENGQIKLNEVLGETFDLYIQKMINQGDILNGPIDESTMFNDIYV